MLFLYFYTFIATECQLKNTETNSLNKALFHSVDITLLEESVNKFLPQILGSAQKFSCAVVRNFCRNVQI